MVELDRNHVISCFHHQHEKCYLCAMQTVKFDVNIEKDLAYALKVKECPQLLFLRGQKIMYREKGNVNVLFLVMEVYFFFQFVF